MRGLNGYNQYLGSSLIYSRFEPSQLALVPILHVLERIKQSLIPKSAGTLFQYDE
jgi:hypothetical protein